MTFIYHWKSVKVSPDNLTAMIATAAGILAVMNKSHHQSTSWHSHTSCRRISVMPRWWKRRSVRWGSILHSSTRCLYVMNSKKLLCPIFKVPQKKPSCKKYRVQLMVESELQYVLSANSLSISLTVVIDSKKLYHLSWSFSWCSSSRSQVGVQNRRVEEAKLNG